MPKGVPITPAFEIEKFIPAETKARRLGFKLRKAENANDLKRYTLEHHGVETHFATIDEVLAKLQRVKPAVK